VAVGVKAADLDLDPREVVGGEPREVRAQRLDVVGVDDRGERQSGGGRVGIGQQSAEGSVVEALAAAEGASCHLDPSASRRDDLTPRGA